jgi:TRAP-type C4-dicarboxylate transport system substrate-binding protein
MERRVYMKGLKNFSTMVAVFMVLFLAIAFYGTPVFGQQKYVLKFNHVLGPKEPYHAGFQKWAKAVEEKTKGGLKIEVFASAQLGVEEDILEQIRAGANVGQNTDSARMGNYVPGIAILNGPYCAENLDEVAKLKNAPTIKGFHDELARRFKRSPYQNSSCTYLAGVCARSRCNSGGSCLWRNVSCSSTKSGGRG